MMATIYVRTTGNDTTGNGATGTPYASLKKALSVAAAGDTILLGDGTYAEDSGSGFLQVNGVFADPGVTITSETGRGQVVISGTSGSYVMASYNAQNVHFDSIVFECQSEDSTAAVRLTGSTLSKVTFTRCTFRVRPKEGTTNFGVNGGFTNAAGANSSIHFRACTFDQLGHGLAGGMTLVNSAGITEDVVVEDCTFNTSGRGILILGIRNVKILRNKVSSWSPTSDQTAFALGVDGATGLLTTGTVIGNVFAARKGHGAVIGAGCDGVLFLGNEVYGGDHTSNGQGLVIKEAKNVRIVRNVITSGRHSGLYFKAAQDCVAVDNEIHNDQPGPALRVARNNESGGMGVCARLTIRGNVFHAVSGSAVNFGPASDDTGGSLVDENVYIVSGSATFGAVRSNPITKMSDLRSAWSGYDRPTNDQNSRLGVKYRPFAGTPLVTLPS